MRRSLKQEIIRRLTSRFDLEPAEYGALLWLNDVIMLTTDVDALLRSINLDSETNDISAGSGYTTYWTVPAGTRWILRRMRIGGTAANTIVRLGMDGTYITLSGASATARDITDLPVPAKEGATVELLNTGNGADTAITCQLLYEEEDAY